MREKYISFFHILSLNCLAIAYPLFQVIGSGPEFFVNRRASALDIWALIAILLFVLPIFLLILRLLLSFLSAKLAERAGESFIWLLSLLYFLVLATASFKFPGYIAIPFALVLASLALLLYIRSSIARTFLSFLSLMLIVAPVSFLTSPGIKKMAFPRAEQDLSALDSKSKTPVVVVLFDEFPLSALLDDKQKVDAKRFPYFAAFAAQSYWFKNATAVNQFTPIAVPAILSGLFPTTNRALPTVDDYPRNLFTMLGASHAMKVLEPFTQLCPESLCKQAVKTTALQRLSLMLLDLSAVYLNLSVPPDLGFKLPDVTGEWGNFWNNVQLAWEPPKFSRDARVGNFLKYINSLKKPKKPTLYFSHHILPHMPFQFMPSGKIYTQGRVYGYENNRWVEDRKAIRRWYHQFLLQAASVDRLLGRFFAKLKEIGVYNDALIIISADHGLSFQPQTYRRGEPGHSQFYEDILSVPMFVKLPGQEHGVESWRNVETIDILPTIADILDISHSWKLDGQSMFAASEPRSEKHAFAGRTPKSAENDEGLENAGEGEGLLLTYPVPEKLPHYTLDWKLGLPGYQEPSQADPYYIGPHSQLIGKRVDEFPTAEAKGLSYMLSMRRCLSQDAKSLVYDPKGGECPCAIRIKIIGDISASEEFALSINGTLWGFDTVASPIRAKEANIFVFLVSEAAFKPGLNAVAVHRVLKDPDNGMVFQALSQKMLE